MEEYNKLLFELSASERGAVDRHIRSNFPQDKWVSELKKRIYKSSGSSASIQKMQETSSTQQAMATYQSEARQVAYERAVLKQKMYRNLMVGAVVIGVTTVVMKRKKKRK